MQYTHKEFNNRQEECLLKSAILNIQNVARDTSIDIKNHPALETCISKLVHYSKNVSEKQNKEPTIDYHFAKWLVQTILSKK